MNGGDPFPNLTFVAPYALPFGRGLTLVVVDSANACDEATPVTNALAIYTAQFGQVPGLIQSEYAWLASHRPIWGVAVKHPSTDCAATPEGCLNAVLQEAIQASSGGVVPPAVRLLLAGHMHRFEALSLDGADRPPQLVIGSTGVALEGTAVTDFTAENLDGQAAHGVQLNEHGFFDIHLHRDGSWRGRLLDGPPGDGALAVCGSTELAKSGNVCRLTED